MKARRKRRLTGSTTDCCSNEAPCIEEKQIVRLPAVRYTHKKNLKKNKNIHTQTHKYACRYLWLYEERQRIRARPLAVRYTQKSKKQTCMLVCLCMCMCMRSESESASHWSPPKHAHISNTENTGQHMSRNYRKSTLSLKHRIAVLSHEKHTHSRKRGKLSKNVRWQGRQRVVAQMKVPVLRRNRELGNHL
jgi:hypothetical protein